MYLLYAFSPRQAFGGTITTDILAQLVQDLTADKQQPLPARLQPGAAAAGGGQQQQRADPVLFCTGADGADVAFVMQLYEHAAALLLEVRRIELPFHVPAARRCYNSCSIGQKGKAPLSVSATPATAKPVPALPM